MAEHTHDKFLASQVNRRTILLAATAVGLAACSKEESVQVVTPAAKAEPVTPTAPLAKAADAPNISVGAMLLPGLINSATDGPMIDLVRAIAATYKGGKMEISAAPVGRVVADMENAVIDMSVPYLRVGDESKLKYRYSTASPGRVQFVLYSKKSASVKKHDVEAAKGKTGADFPYKIESALIPWDFPTIQFTDMTSAFKKLDAGHIHAFLWAQEEADAELRKLGLTGITREAFGTFEDVFAIVRGPRGDFVDKIISDGIKELAAAGKLQNLYAQIHKPYDPWQP